MSGQNDTLAPGKRPKWESDPIIAVASAVTVSTIASAGSLANPNSAGRYPIGRKFSVDDEATFDTINLQRDVVLRRGALRVTSVDEESDRVLFNDGRWISDTLGNFIKEGAIQFDLPVQFVPSELYVGKKWRASYLKVGEGGVSQGDWDLAITVREKIAVPAGEFFAFRVDGTGFNKTSYTQLKSRYWLVPGLNFTVRYEITRRGPRLNDSEAYVLVSFKQIHSSGA
jgi:hypothetical protein